ncbi:hypothetical protein GGQ73_000649 [Rhizobium skierniewicense]|uniref:HNH endonuclease n=1 Tax=Rhizobium skierniewicense TaxID=984260 RepID=A0A7W6C5B0_9HYPH|nr:hypothetical protein [Rhizobium skierniewicense]MBB3944724.1 hypothetical protein [Rhizobium skierniewicense]
MADLCKLCGEEKKLIKSHVIPKAFFPNSATTKLLSSDKFQFPRKAPIGVYDEGILCAACDSNLGIFDQAAAEQLLTKVGHVPPETDGLARVYHVTDTELIRRFVISVAWRAHHSTHAMFRSVHLGPYETLFKHEVLEPTTQRTSVCVTEFDNRNVPFLSPAVDRFENVRFLRIYAARFLFLVKVDKQRMPSDFENLDIAHRDRDFIGSVVQSWRGSGEELAMREMVTLTPQNISQVHKWRKTFAGAKDPVSVFRIAAMS